MNVIYFLAGEPQPVSEDSQVWDLPLPMDREGNPATGPNPFTFGDYFLAARQFLVSDDTMALKNGIALLHKGPASPDQIDSIAIYSEKHGEFYHPARILVHCGRRESHFVLNVALSEVGKRYIRDEYDRLERLGGRAGCDFLPSVFGFGQVEIPDKPFQALMFLGQWFEGYCEFHISGQGSLAEKAVVVWDPEGGNFFLSETQKYALYREVARILTCYYDPENFAQIYPWHHAAGDFVVRIQNGHVSVKLITVRGYKPHADSSDPDPGSFLMALALFLLTLSIRNRIDRMDGVGEFVWSDPVAVQASIDGFFLALFEKPAPDWMEGAVWEFFQIYIGSFSLEDFAELFNDILESYRKNSAQFEVVRANLDDHCRMFHQCLSRYLSDRAE